VTAAEPPVDAFAVLDALQGAVDARDLDALASLFDEQAVLIGTGGDARDPAALRRYLTALATQPESLRWEWNEIVPVPPERGVARLRRVRRDRRLRRKR
jgi:hypothetical protein